MNSVAHPSPTLHRPSHPQADPGRPLRVLAETGLRLVLRSLAATEHAVLPAVDIVFGSSNALARLVSQGDPVDLLLTTDDRLAAATAPARAAMTEFARDTLMVAGRSELRLTAASLVARLANPRLRVGIAFPSFNVDTDPAGQFCNRLDALQPGAGATLRAKAKPMQANGDLPPPRRIMEMLGSGEVDIVLGAASALRTLSAVADLVAPPIDLAVEITAWLVVLATDAKRRKTSEAYLAVLQGMAGQALLARHGFSSPAAPV